jgi:hypothetical protein
MQKPELCQTAKKTIAELLDEGIVCSAEESLWIQQIGERIEHPNWMAGGVFSGESIFVGGVTLFALTIGAARWWYEVALPAFGEHATTFLALVYAMAHSRDVETLNGLTSPRSIRRAVNTWTRNIGATQEEIRHAVDTLLNRDAPDSVGAEAGNRERAEWQDIIAFMIAACGGTRMQWEWEVSRSFVMRVLRQYCRINAARGVRLDPDDPGVRATGDMIRAKQHIRAAHAEQKAKAQEP